MNPRNAGAIAFLLLGCGGTEPEVNPFVGRWLLQTVNGQNLPASGQIIGQTFLTSEGGYVPTPVTAGRLEINAPGRGFPTWEWCEDRPQTSSDFVSREVLYASGATDEETAELVYTAIAVTVTDTIRVSGEGLTMAYNWNQDDQPHDLLRFRRLAEGEAEEPVCLL